jgi:hypothetical protein
MCNCENFSDLSHLLANLARVNLPPPSQLFHGGCFPKGAPLSAINCGLWCSDNYAAAAQYANWGRQPGTVVGVIKIDIKSTMEVLVLPSSPISFLQKHYGPLLPAHSIMNRDICCTLASWPSPKPVGLVYPGKEWFLCDAHNYATLKSHTIV